MSDAGWTQRAVNLDDLMATAFALACTGTMVREGRAALRNGWDHVYHFDDVCPWCGKTARYVISGQASVDIEDPARRDEFHVVTSCSECDLEIAWQVREERDGAYVMPLIAFERFMLPCPPLPAAVSEDLGASATENE